MCMVLTLTFVQDSCAQAGKAPQKIAGGFDKVKILAPGAPTPRAADGHPDLTGRYYPNMAGRMLQGAYPIDRTITRQYDPEKTPQVDPVFRPEAAKKFEFERAAQLRDRVKALRAKELGLEEAKL